MKPSPLLALASLLATVALGQEVETTVFLPESLCGLGWIEYMIWNPANNQVYAANWQAGSAIAVSASSGQKTARIPFGDYGGRLCVAADLNKVYAYDQSRRTLAVIDGNTNTVVRQLYVPVDDPHEVWLAYSPLRQKLYCLSYLGQLAVLDATSDTFKGCRWVYRYNQNGGLLYNAAADKLYSAIVAPFSYGVLVIDGARDTTAALVGVDFSSDDPRMVLNDSSNKVYFESDMDIAVVSGTADTLRAQLEPEVTDAAGICCNPLTNRIYAAYEYVESLDGPGVLVLDGDADTIITAVSVSSVPASIVCSPASNRVYVGLHSDSAAVISGASNQVVATIRVGPSPHDFACYDASDDAIFVSAGGQADLVKVDCPSNSLAHVEDLGCKPRLIAYAGDQDRLFVLDWYPAFLNIIDGSTNKVRRSQALPSAGYDMAYNRDKGSMCVALGDSGLAVFDCATDSLLRILDVRAEVMVYDSVRRKVYCAGNSSFWVLNAEAETVLTEIPELAGTSALCLNAGRGKLYTGTQYPPYGIHVIDCNGDTILGVLETSAVYSRFACSETYDKLYAHKFGGKLLVVDCVTDRVDSLLPGGHAIGDVSVNEDGTRLLCYGGGGPTLVLDCATDSVVAELDTVKSQSEGWSRAAVWSHDSRRIYVPSWHLGVVVLDAENGGVDSIRTGNHPMGVLLHPTADRAYVANEYSSSLTVIRDEVGIAETPSAEVRAADSGPTIVRGMLFVRVENRGQSLGAPASDSARDSPRFPRPVLLDVSGRKVLDLHTGANDVSRHAPGVYFVREAQAQAQAQAKAVRKVIIAR